MHFSRLFAGVAAVARLVAAGVVDERAVRELLTIHLFTTATMADQIIAPPAYGDSTGAVEPSVTRMVIINYMPAVSVSTVYSTSDVTVYSCASSVTDCPAGSTSLVTAVVPLSTTLCPLTLTSVSTSNVTQTASPTATPASAESGTLSQSATPDVSSIGGTLAGSSPASESRSADADAASETTSSALQTLYRTGSSTMTIFSSAWRSESSLAWDVYSTEAPDGTNSAVATIDASNVPVYFPTSSEVPSITGVVVDGVGGASTSSPTVDAAGGASTSTPVSDTTGIPVYGVPTSATDANGNTVDAVGGASSSSPASDVTGTPAEGSIPVSGEVTSTTSITSTIFSTERITVSQSTATTGSVAAGSESPVPTGTSNNETVVICYDGNGLSSACPPTSSTVADAADGTVPASSNPYSFVPSTSTSVVIVDASGGASGLPVASNNGSLGSTTQSAIPTPFTGDGVATTYDSKIFICWALALFGGILLI
ncbi:hypothetical protein MBLNU230_g3603t1 [Neophaeotheca triangularis]